MADDDVATAVALLDDFAAEAPDSIGPPGLLTAIATVLDEVDRPRAAVPVWRETTDETRQMRGILIGLPGQSIWIADHYLSDAEAWYVGGADYVDDTTTLRWQPLPPPPESAA